MSSTSPKLRAVIYCRVATARQRTSDECEPAPLSAQQATAREHAAHLGYQIVSERSEKGTSGRTPEK